MRGARWVTAVAVTVAFPAASLVAGLAYLALRRHWSGRLVATLLAVLDANVVQHDELSQPDAVDQDESCAHPLGVIPCLGGEPACGDEDASVGLRAVQGPDEGLDLRAADGMVCCVPLGPYVDPVQTENTLPHNPSRPWSPLRPRCSAAPARPP
jgi:hypothetical protein